MKQKKKIRNLINALIFLLPALIIYTVFRMYPAVTSLYYGFTDWNGLNKDFNFVGFSNFLEIFKDDMIKQSIANTVIYSLVVTVLQNILGLIFAVLVDNKRMKGKNFFRTVLFLPSVLNTSAICFIWAIILSPVIGVWGTMITKLGLSTFIPIDLLGGSNTALLTIAFVNIWQFMGYSMVIYLAGLQTVPDDLYEAAEIDGCNRRQRFWNITMPMIAPSITINIILTTVGTLKEFEHVYVLTNGGPGNASQVIGTAIYKVAFGDTQRFGYGIAISTLLMLAICGITVVQQIILKKREVAFE